MVNSSSNHKIIGSVDRAIKILNFLYSKDTEQSVTDIARELDISVSAAHHLLYTLKRHQLVDQDNLTKKYFLGVRLAIMGDKVKSDNYLIEFCRPYLKELMSETGETANLSVLKDGRVVYIAQEENNKLIRMFTELGACVDAHCSGSGKVLLSGLSDESIIGIVRRRGLKTYTRNTITDIEELMKEIRVIRDKGYSLDNEEREEGVMCIAAPVMDYTGTIIASVSISGPAARFREKKDKYIECVVDVCNRISKALGYKKEGNV